MFENWYNGILYHITNLADSYNPFISYYYVYNMYGGIIIGLKVICDGGEALRHYIENGGRLNNGWY